MPLPRRLLLAALITALFSGVLLLSAPLSAAVSNTPSEPRPVRIITLSTPLIAKPLHDQGHPIVERLHKVYAALGYQLNIVFHPALRSLALANTGQVDGELSRSAAIEPQYPNLLRVDVAVSHIYPGIYTLASEPVKSWRENKNSTFAASRGSTLIMQAIPSQLQNAQLQLVSSSVQALKMLNAGRVDSILLIDQEVAAYSLLYPLLTEQLVRLEPALAPIPLYIYLHKNHRELLPALTAQLRQEFAPKRRESGL